MAATVYERNNCSPLVALERREASVPIVPHASYKFLTATLNLQYNYHISKTYQTLFRTGRIFRTN